MALLSLSERGSLQSESYQVQCISFMLQGWSVKIAWGHVQQPQHLPFRCQQQRHPYLSAGLNVWDREAKAMSWHCSASSELCWKVPSQGSPQRHVPRLLSHKWTRTFSTTTSKTLMSCEPYVGISGFLKVKRSAHDLC